MEKGRDNDKNKAVWDKFMDHDLTEYSSHALAEVVGGGKRNDWILVTRYRIGNLKYEQDNNMRTDNK